MTVELTHEQLANKRYFDQSFGTQAADQAYRAFRDRQPEESPLAACGRLGRRMGRVLMAAALRALLPKKT